MDILGHTFVTANCGKMEITIKLLVVNDLSRELLLSWKDCIALGIIQTSFPFPTDLSTPPVIKSDTCVKTSATTSAADVLSQVTREFPTTINDNLNRFPIKSSRKIHIALKAGQITPSYTTVAKLVSPKHLHLAAEAVDKLVQANIIVPVSKPTAWCSSAHFTSKQVGKTQLITEFKQLETVIDSRLPPPPRVSDIAQKIPAEATCFAAFRSLDGSYQLELDEASSFLTTFLIPSGRYRFKRLPMGLSPSYTTEGRLASSLAGGLHWAIKNVDDILIWARTFTSLLTRLRIFLGRCRNINLKISRENLQLGRRVNFANHMITPKGIQPLPTNLGVLATFPQPKNARNLQEFLRLAHQMYAFVPAIEKHTAGLAELAKTRSCFDWLKSHNWDFQVIKRAMYSRITPIPFHAHAEAIIIPHAHKLGLGYSLLHRSDSAQPLKLIKAGSRGITAEQAKYTKTELECLALVFACSQCESYLRLVPHFYVEAQHKELADLFSQPIDKIEDIRLIILREAVADYSFTVEWSPGPIQVDKNSQVVSSPQKEASTYPPREQTKPPGVTAAPDIPKLPPPSPSQKVQTWLQRERAAGNVPKKLPKLDSSIDTLSSRVRAKMKTRASVRRKQAREKWLTTKTKVEPHSQLPAGSSTPAAT